MTSAKSAAVARWSSANAMTAATTSGNETRPVDSATNARAPLAAADLSAVFDILVHQNENRRLADGSLPQAIAHYHPCLSGSPRQSMNRFANAADEL
jgi:hypothetical protein